jgi:hypothetical protein
MFGAHIVSDMHEKKGNSIGLQLAVYEGSVNVKHKGEIYLRLANNDGK